MFDRERQFDEHIRCTYLNACPRYKDSLISRTVWYLSVSSLSFQVEYLKQNTKYSHFILIQGLQIAAERPLL